MARVPKLMQNASFVCVVVRAFSHIFLQLFNSIKIFNSILILCVPLLSLKEQLCLKLDSANSEELVGRAFRADRTDARTDGRTHAELKVSKGRPGET